MMYLLFSSVPYYSKEQSLWIPDIECFLYCDVRIQYGRKISKLLIPFMTLQTVAFFVCSNMLSGVLSQYQFVPLFSKWLKLLILLILMKILWGCYWTLYAELRYECESILMAKNGSRSMHRHKFSLY